MTTRAEAHPDEYWNEALETMPWADVAAWQAQQLAAFLGPLRRRSAMYARLLQDVPPEFALRSLADLQALPFTSKDAIRAAQDAATEHQPLGENQSVATDDIVQVLSSSGTTGAPLYYALTAADVERVTTPSPTTSSPPASVATTWLPTWSGCRWWRAGCPMPAASGGSVRRSAGRAAFPPIASCGECAARVRCRPACTRIRCWQ